LLDCTIVLQLQGSVSAADVVLLFHGLVDDVVLLFQVSVKISGRLSQLSVLWVVGLAWSQKLVSERRSTSAASATRRSNPKLTSSLPG